MLIKSISAIKPGVISLLPLLIFFFAGSELLAQQGRVNILNAGRAEGGTIDGEPVRKLINDVRLATDRMIMECDSAYQFLDRNMVHAFNIQIETDDDIIWADTLFYNTFTDYSQLRGRVIIESENNLLFGEKIDFDRILDVAIFLSPVRFEDESGVLIADNGYYFQNTDVGFFRGDVQLVDSLQYLEADSLFMNRQAEFYRLFNSVYAKDYEENITFSGNFLEADSTGFRHLSGDAWMMQVNDAETDTSHLNATIIEVQEADTVTFIDSYEEVRIWSTDFAALADTAHYRDDIGQFRLISNPVAWQKNIQLTGPYIEALIENDQIKFLTSFPNPIAVQQDTVTNRLNQMKGDTLQAFFEEGEIREIIVFDNSELIFHQKDEDGEPDGLIELIAGSSTTISFFNGELDRFLARENIDGSYLPEDPANINRQLPGFRWDPEMRPGKPDIRQRRLPDISPDRPFELPPRYLQYLEERMTESW